MDMLISAIIMIVSFSLVINARKGAIAISAGIVYASAWFYWLSQIWDFTADGYHDSFCEKLLIVVCTCAFTAAGFYMLFNGADDD